MKQAINVEHLAFAYPQAEGQMAVPIFEDLSLFIEEGSFVAVLGHNGCGKSTLAKQCNAVLLPSGGSMTVYGMDTRQEALLYEIQGADKVRSDSRVGSAEDYLANIRFAIFDRDDIDLEQTLVCLQRLHSGLHSRQVGVGHGVKGAK